MDDFNDIIGQNKAKNKLRFFVQSYKNTGITQPILLTAPKGQGKSYVARAFGRRLVNQSGTPKPFVTVNASSIPKSISGFFDSIILPYLIDRDVTIFIDEASEIPEKPQMALLTILEKNNTGITEYVHDGQRFTFDLRRISWLFATSEPHKVWHALVDRLEEISLEESRVEDLMQIIRKNVNENISINEDVLFEIASVSRNSPRTAVSWAEKINIYGCTEFNREVWSQIKENFSVVKHGLNEAELSVLSVLKKYGNATLTSLAAKTGYSRQALQRKIEPNLMKYGLIEVAVNGRKLTFDGRRYLENINQLVEKN